MKTIFTAAFTLFSAVIIAQDTIITTSGEMIPGVVKNISSTEVEYKKSSNPDGPTYIRSKSEVLAIRYKNGTVDKFSSAAKSQGNDDYYGGSAAAKTSASSKNMSDVISATSITFYGVDFSNFSLVEPKRKLEAEKIKAMHFPEWNTFFVTEVPAKTMARWMKKYDVSYTTEAVNNINKSANPDKIVSAFPIDQDMKENIRRSVAAYASSDTRTQGIGFVVNVEYFYKAKQETSAYFTFFDIATHQVISSEHVIVKEVGGAGLTKFWGAGLVAAMREYVDKRYKRY
jgi:hypothetical protein